MEPVRSAEQGFFPLDEELALLPGNLAPSIEDHLSHLASWMPFRRAAQMLSRLLGVQESLATIRRHTETAGSLYEQQQTAASHESAPASDSVPIANRLVLSADGAYVGLIKGAWAEVRTLVIGEVEQPTSPEQKGQTQALSYFSRMMDAQTFADLAEVETRRRGVVQAKEVAAITDGAEWLQGLIDLHRPDALRILDFAHAAQRFGMIAEVSAQHGQALPESWVQEQCHDLKYEGPAPVLERLRALPLAEAQEEHLHYLEKRETHMDYPASASRRLADWLRLGRERQQGGDASTLASGAGMRWAPSHVNPMLALRTAICNDRWDEAWREVQKQRTRGRATTRQQRAEAKQAALLSSFLLLLLRFPPSAAKASSPPPPPSSLPPQPAATLPGSSRPSASHPWKRTPACRPKLAATN
jgi:hypothetical protein